MSWGKSLICDISGCDLELIKNEVVIADFVYELVQLLKMTAYGFPNIVHFGVDDKKGYTLVQLIETSCITAHFSEDTCKAFVDIFSCKDYDCQEVVMFCKEYFGGKSVWWQSTYRG